MVVLAFGIALEIHGQCFSCVLKSTQRWLWQRSQLRHVGTQILDPELEYSCIRVVQGSASQYPPDVFSGRVFGTGLKARIIVIAQMRIAFTAVKNDLDL